MRPVIKYRIILPIAFLVTLAGMNNMFFQGIQAQELVLLSTSTNHIETANMLYKQERYHEAIPFYQEARKEHTKNNEVLVRLGNSYLFSRQYFAAIEIYEQHIKQTRNVDALVYFHLGEAYRAMGNYQKARQAYQTIQTNLLPDIYQSITRQAIAACSFAQNTQDKKLHTDMKKLPDTIVTGMSTFSPAIVLDTLWFLSTQREQTRQKVELDVHIKGKYRHQYRSNPQYTHKKEGRWQKALSISNSSQVQGDIQSIFPLGQGRLFLCLCQEQKEKQADKHCAIYYGTYQKTSQEKYEINKLQKLASPVNTKIGNSLDPNYIETQNGHFLFFSSNRHGTHGGYDIYYCKLNDDFSPLSCQNAGKPINTVENEVSPFYDSQLERLYFSSTGHMSMGAYDIVYSEGVPFDTFKAINNPGGPINSGADEWDYKHTPVKGTLYQAYLSSNRPDNENDTNTCCNTLYSFRYHIAPEDKAQYIFEIYDSVTQDTLHLSTLTIRGKTDKQIIYEEQALQTSQHQVMLNNNSNYKLHVQRIGYHDKYLEFSADTHDQAKDISIFISHEIDKWQEDVPTTENDTIHKTQPMVAPPITKDISEKEEETISKLELPTLYYTFGGNVLPATEKVKLDKLVQQLNTDYPKIKLVIASHTDNIDSRRYNMRLSSERNQAAINYLVEKGIERDRLLGQWYGEEEPTAPNQIGGKDNPEGRALNRRSEIKAISNFDGIKQGQMVDIPPVDPSTFTAQTIDIELDEETLSTLVARHGNKQVEGLEFRIQIGAYMHLEKYRSYREALHQSIRIQCKVNITTETAGKFTRFMTSGAASLGEAKKMEKRIRQLDVPGAFMVPYYKGERIHLLNALELFSY